MPAQLKEAYLKVSPNKKGLQTMFDRDKNRMLSFKDWKDDDLRSIKAKTLFLVADHDVITPEHTVNMYHLVSNAQLMILPGTHGSYLGEVCSAVPGSKTPEMTVNMIEEFLRD
jgi:pimeloyl-ACP methyl ester carboxylesterase